VVVEGSHICDIDVLDEPLIPSTSTNGRVSITGDTMTIFNIPYGAVGVGLKYESELQTVPLELGDPSQVFTGSKVQIVSANFKMSKSYIGFQYGVGLSTTPYITTTSPFSFNPAHWLGRFTIIFIVSEVVS
jgi:hypothetical protein